MLTPAFVTKNSTTGNQALRVASRSAGPSMIMESDWSISEDEAELAKTEETDVFPIDAEDSGEDADSEEMQVDARLITRRTVG